MVFIILVFICICIKLDAAALLSYQLRKTRANFRIVEDQVSAHCAPVADARGMNNDERMTRAAANLLAAHAAGLDAAGLDAAVLRSD